MTKEIAAWRVLFVPLVVSSALLVIFGLSNVLFPGIATEAVKIGLQGDNDQTLYVFAFVFLSGFAFRWYIENIGQIAKKPWLQRYAQFAPFIVGITVSLPFVGVITEAITSPNWPSSKSFGTTLNPNVHDAISSLLAVIGVIGISGVLSSVQPFWKNDSELEHEPPYHAGLQRHINKIARPLTLEWCAMLIIAMGLFWAFSNPFESRFASMIGSISVVLAWAFAALIFFFPIAAWALQFTGDWRYFRQGVPVFFTLFSFAIILSLLDINNNHEIRQIPSPPENMNSEPSKLELVDWIASRSPTTDPKARPIILVAAEGGGVRSAFVTSYFLAAMQDACPEFGKSLYAVSGVSGGALGAVLYTAMQKTAGLNVKEVRRKCLSSKAFSNGPKGQKAAQNTSDNSTRRLRNWALDFWNFDIQSPLLASLAFPDALQRVVPFVAFKDRAQAIEGAWEQAWTVSRSRYCVIQGERKCPETELMGEPLSALTPTNSLIIPALILGATSVQTGMPASLSTLKFVNNDDPTTGVSEFESAHDSMTSAHKGEKSEDISISSSKPVHFADCGLLNKVPISAAAFFGARFPIAMPIAKIDCDQGSQIGHHRMVDGGYFENTGTYFLNEVLTRIILRKAELSGTSLSRQIDQRTKDKLSPTITSPVYVVIIKSRFKREDQTLGLNELLSPILTIINTRNARSETTLGVLSDSIKTWSKMCEMRNKSLGDGSDILELCKESLQKVNKRPIYLVPVTVDFTQYNVPLSFALSKNTTNNLSKGIEREIESRLKIAEYEDYERYNGSTSQEKEQTRQGHFGTQYQLPQDGSLFNGPVTETKNLSELIIAINESIR